MSKLTRELTLEELLAALEKAPERDELEVEEKEYFNNIPAFLHFYDIKNGDVPVDKRILRRIYMNWAVMPMSNLSFQLELGKFITKHDSQHYYINKETLDLALSAYQYLKENRTIKKLKSPQYRQHFDRFLKYHGLSRGTKYVPVFVLYHLYDKWTYRNKTKTTLSQGYFQEFCNLTFERKNVRGTYAWYRVNEESISKYFTDEKIEALIDYRNRHVQKYKKGTHKKHKTKNKTPAGSELKFKSWAEFKKSMGRSK